VFSVVIYEHCDVNLNTCAVTVVASVDASDGFADGAAYTQPYFDYDPGRLPSTCERQQLAVVVNARPPLVVSHCNHRFLSS